MWKLEFQQYFLAIFSFGQSSQHWAFSGSTNLGSVNSVRTTELKYEQDAEWPMAVPCRAGIKESDVFCSQFWDGFLCFYFEFWAGFETSIISGFEWVLLSDSLDNFAGSSCKTEKPKQGKLFWNCVRHLTSAAKPNIKVEKILKGVIFNFKASFYLHHWKGSYFLTFFGN